MIPDAEDMAFFAIVSSTHLADHQHPQYDCGHLDQGQAPIDRSLSRVHCLVCGQILQQATTTDKETT